MRRVLLLSLMFVGVASLAGCPSKPKNGECKSSADCAQQEGYGKVCVEGRCQECGTDAETLAVALRQLTLLEMHLKRFLDLGKALELRRQPCELGSLVHEAVALVGPQCRHANIDLHRKASNTKLPLQGDPAQLGHLLLNVLTQLIPYLGYPRTLNALRVLDQATLDPQ